MTVPAAMRFTGKVLWLTGLVGLISPWLPDPGDHAASDDLTGWGLVAWLAVCLAIAGLGMWLTVRADARAARPFPAGTDTTRDDEKGQA